MELKKINKTQARKLWNKGESIIITNAAGQEAPTS